MAPTEAKKDKVSDPLVALLRNPHVQCNIDFEFAHGLFDARRTDYLIGRAVDAAVRIKSKDEAAASEIEDGLALVREDDRYERYFRSNPRVPTNPEDRVKPRSYKAIESIGH